MSNIDFNEKFKEAYEAMEKSSENVFITGRAGTGKSTLLDYFRNSTKKEVVVLAPTGVAALNVKGKTIHSFFGFRPDITLQKVKKLAAEDTLIYKKLDAIVIDEISMVRSDLLDCVDKFLRINGKNNKKPFGGIQMIFIGDLYQLPPVVMGTEKEIFRKEYASEYFFDAKVLEDFKMKFIELEKIYRQKDADFINLLNAIRNNSITEEELENINKRHNPDFECSEGEFYIYLTPTNAASQEINEKKLRELDGKLYHYEGLISGNFDVKYLPTDINLNLKIGAQVMMLNNDARKRWVNGTIGKIVKIKKDKDLEMDVIFVEFADGEVEEVVPYTWDIYDFYFDKNKGHIESSSVGSFSQYPMKLAWSVTIHKSQGKTFDKVVLDIGKGTFAHGQMYVALSRCTTLEGIILKKKILKRHIWMDWRVVKFVTGFQYDISEKNMSLDDKIKMIEEAIAEKKKLAITYLKANDIKSKRTILPRKIGEMEFMNKTFIGVAGMCLERGEDRTFRVDRILEMNILGE